jgi:CheY-like chemotaxis protein
MGFMKTKEEGYAPTEPLHVLLIGNNPTDLGSVLEKLKQVRGQRIITEIAFDLKSIVERLIRFRPNFIFIDDNLGRPVLSEAVKALSVNRWTKNIPIAVLKNSNYKESLGANSIFDYVLKQNVSSEELYKTVRNALKLRRTQLYLYQAYQKRRRQLMNLTR